MDTAQDTALWRKITFRLLPLLILLYTVAYVDRSAVGFAQLTMGTDIGIDAAAFGLGSGLFFLGYFLFEVPSNMLMRKTGARVWFFRILLSWGIVTMLTAFIWNEWSFYVVRFLLGVCEAGFYPGVIVYLATWFPHRNLTKATGRFVVAAPLAFVILSPLAGWLVSISGGGMDGWQWLFIVVGGVAVLCAFVDLAFLPKSPQTVHWLTDDEKNYVESELEKDKVEMGLTDTRNPLRSLVDPRVLIFSAVFFCQAAGVYGLSFWLPQVIKAFNVTDWQVGLLTDIPYLCALVAVFWAAGWVNKHFKWNWKPLIVILVIAGVFIALSAAMPVPALQLIALAIVAMAAYNVAGVFWQLPNGILTGATAAVGIAAINSIGNLGGFVGPYAVGLLTKWTGNTKAGMFLLGGIFILGAILTPVAKRVITNYKVPEQDLAINRTQS